MSDQELDEVREQIERDKKLRRLMQTGDFYRLKSTYETHYCSWEMVSKDKSEAFVFACRILSITNYQDNIIKIKGLDADSDYVDIETGKKYGGDELMYIGIEPEYERCDFSSFIMRLQKVVE